MDEVEIVKLNELESDNWWFLGRRDLITRLIPKGTTTVFEIGVGCGKNLEVLNDLGYAVEGLDISETAIRFSKSKGLNVHHSAVEDYAFSKQYDVVLLADVLEHIRDDALCLKKAGQALKQDGHVIITVPAFQFLFSTNDYVNHHKRRYEFNELKSLLEISGFEVQKMSYWNALLFSPAVALKLFKKYAVGKQGSSDLFKTPKPLNALLASILVKENDAILSNVRLPFGVSIVCLARKK